MKNNNGDNDLYFVNKNLIKTVNCLSKTIIICN